MLLGTLLRRLLADARPATGHPPGRTAWGAYNAVTEYLDHQRTWRGETEEDRRGNRFEALVLGYGKEIQQRAFDAALALA